MKKMIILATLLATLVGCGGSTLPNDDESEAATDVGSESSTDAAEGSADTAENSTDTTGNSTGTKVTFTVYIDAACTQLPPRDSTVELDASTTCNSTPDASISDLVCHADRITYTNHPNNSDCSSAGIPNELFVGVCQEFPGPVQTWKLINHENYNCLTSGL